MKNWKRLLYLKIARKLSKNDNSIPVPTIISVTTNVKGDITTDGILQIDGHVEGDVSCSELVIGLKGSLIGGATVKDLQLYGTVKGRVSADNLFISKTAKLIGDASHRSIAIEPGAYIDGHCMRVNSKATLIAQAETSSDVAEEKGKVVLIEKSRAKKKVG